MTTSSSDAADGRTPLQRLAVAPHRGFFACGALSLLLMAGWWASQLLWPTAGAFPPSLVHALMTPLGTFPLFMLGFIFTAGPRWLSVAPLKGHLLIAIAYLGGLAATLLCFAFASAWAPLSLAVMLASFASGIWVWLRCCRASEAPDKGHAWRLLAALLVGLAALAASLLWAMTGNPQWWMAARELALWGFLLPVFLIVSHRMLPFFTQSAMPMQLAWRPWHLLNAWLAACALLVFAKLTDLTWLNALAALALAASFAYTSWRWGLLASLSNRLLAMLHLAFAWLTPALLLEALRALGLPVGTAAAHALALGFCFTMLIGFVTRVSLGHSGRGLRADGAFWAIYLGFHAIAIARVLLALSHSAGMLMQALSIAWAALLLGWAARLIPIYLAARADGKPD